MIAIREKSLKENGCPYCGCMEIKKYSEFLVCCNCQRDFETVKEEKISNMGWCELFRNGFRSGIPVILSESGKYVIDSELIYGPEKLKEIEIDEYIKEYLEDESITEIDLKKIIEKLEKKYNTPDYKNEIAFLKELANFGISISIENDDIYEKLSYSLPIVHPQKDLTFERPISENEESNDIVFTEVIKNDEEDCIDINLDVFYKEQAQQIVKMINAINKSEYNGEGYNAIFTDVDEFEEDDEVSIKINCPDLFKRDILYDMINKNKKITEKILREAINTPANFKTVWEHITQENIISEGFFINKIAVNPYLYPIELEKIVLWHQNDKNYLFQLEVLGIKTLIDYEIKNNNIEKAVEYLQYLINNYYNNFNLLIRKKHSKHINETYDVFYNDLVNLYNVYSNKPHSEPINPNILESKSLNIKLGENEKNTLYRDLNLIFIEIFKIIDLRLIRISSALLNIKETNQKDIEEIIANRIKNNSNPYIMYLLLGFYAQIEKNFKDGEYNLVIECIHEVSEQLKLIQSAYIEDEQLSNLINKITELDSKYYQNKKGKIKIKSLRNS